MNARLQKELKMLEKEPPYGICVWPKADDMTILQAQIQGPTDSPYEKGTFLLDIVIPTRYPFEPPKVKFATPIYHPNIDSAGRICLDTLKMQPKGAWQPSVNLSTLLTTIRLLMAEPNVDDGLMPEITRECKENHSQFLENARQSTLQHAVVDTVEKSSTSNILSTDKPKELLQDEDNTEEGLLHQQDEEQDSSGYEYDMSSEEEEDVSIQTKKPRL